MIESDEQMLVVRCVLRNGRRPIHAAIAAASHLMQTAKPQPSSRQPSVDVSQAEGRNDTRASARTFEMRNTFSKLSDSGTDRMARHDAKTSPSGLCNDGILQYVHYLFSFRF